MIRPLDDISSDSDNNTGTMGMDPSSRLQDIRKRMRTGRHKYAVPGRNADDEVVSSSQASIFEHPTLPLASPGQDDAAELVDLLRMRDAYRNAQSATSTTTPAARPTAPTLSPPPTPGRDHDTVSFPSEFPKVLPLGSAGHQVSDDTADADGGQTEPMSPKVNPPSMTSMRLRPSFASTLLQDLISSHQSKTKGPNGDGVSGGSSPINKLPELPFQTDVTVTASSSLPPSASNDTKTAATMSMTRLPHWTHERTERSTAA